MTLNVTQVIHAKIKTVMTSPHIEKSPFVLYASPHHTRYDDFTGYQGLVWWDYSAESECIYPSAQGWRKTDIADHPHSIWTMALHKISDHIVQGWRYFLGQGSVCFVLKFALTPFSPPLPSGVQISKTKHAPNLLYCNILHRCTPRYELWTFKF